MRRGDIPLGVGRDDCIAMAEAIKRFPPEDIPTHNHTACEPTAVTFVRRRAANRVKELRPTLTSKVATVDASNMSAAMP